MVCDSRQNILLKTDLHHSLVNYVSYVTRILSQAKGRNSEKAALRHQAGSSVICIICKARGSRVQGATRTVYVSPLACDSLVPKHACSSLCKNVSHGPRPLNTDLQLEVSLGGMALLEEVSLG